MLIVFVALIAGPLVVRRLNINLPTIPDDLLQPINQDNNDTTSLLTGSNLPGNEKAASTGAIASALGLSRMMFMF
jgi:1,3-beta-glucan synthase